MAVFEDTYRALAADIGVRLAPLDDPDKAFSGCTRGVVLGVEYDTVAWTWAVPAAKLARMIVQIRNALAAETIKQEEMWSLVGRILHYAPVVPGGRFNLRELLVANTAAKEGGTRVAMTARVRRQLSFWELMLRVCSGWARIPPYEGSCPAWATSFFTDAAGGSAEEGLRGCGGVSGEWWFFGPWPAGVNNGSTRVEGKKLGRKLSALELVGPLVCLLGAADRCRGRAVRILVDNSGAVEIWRKGYSMRCVVCSRLVEAMAAVAAALCCRVWVEKVERCSCPGAVVADHLSKGAWGAAKAAAQAAGEPLAEEPVPVLRALWRWLADPDPEVDLAAAVLRELAGTTAVLGAGRSYAA